MEMDYQKIGQRIQYWRMNKKMSQEDLASAVFCSLSHLGAVERGTKAPSLQLLVAIADVLGVTSNELLTDSLASFNSDNTGRIHLLLLDCSKDKQIVLIRILEFMKATLSEFGI